MKFPLGHVYHLNIPDDLDKLLHPPAQAYARDTKAMAGTPADVKEYPDRYVFVLDMSGIKSSDLKVQIENENVLVVAGERQHDEKVYSEAKYIRMERRVGKFLRNFMLTQNANFESIYASCQDSVLTVTVPKIPPPEPKKPKTIEVTIG